MKRKSGVLLHISSLPSVYGIGNFGKSAYRFVDMLKSGGFSVWQVLPFCMPDGYNSPYKSRASFSVNPYFIDGFQSGDYYLYKYENAPFKDKDDIDNKYDVHRGKLDIFNHSRKPGGDHPEIGKFMSSVMKMRKENEDVLTKGSFIPLDVAENPEDRILAFARHHKGKTLLTIVNRNVNSRETGAIKVPGLPAGTTLKNIIEPYGDESHFQVNKDSIISVNLGKARACVFEIATPNIENSGLKVYKQKQ